MWICEENGNVISKWNNSKAKYWCILGSHSHLCLWILFLGDYNIWCQIHTCFTLIQQLKVRGCETLNEPGTKKRQRAESEWVREDKSDEIACWWHSLGLLNSNIWQTAREKGNILAESATPSNPLQNPAKKSPPLDELFPLSAVWVQWEKKIGPRAEILKLGNSGMSNNTEMN